jgi:exosortase
MDMEALNPPQNVPQTERTEAAETTDTKPDADTPREKSLWARLTTGDWVVIGCLLVLFGPMLYEMYELWTEPEAPQAYGLLILPAALGLAWMLRSRLKDLIPRPSAVGLLPVILGIGFLFLGTSVKAITLSGFGFVLVMLGIVWARYGMATVRRLWFPLAFLLAMVPLPHEFLNVITFPLQGLSVKLASLFLTPLGDVTTRGTRIFLSNYTLDVVAPCSGLTIVLPLFILSIYYLYIMDAPLWKKLFLAFLTLPVAMLVNAVRVGLIGVVGELKGAKAADIFHDYSGILTVVAGFAALFFIAQEMKCSRLSEEITL